MPRLHDQGLSGPVLTREEFLNSVIGKPWVANAKGPDAFDCFHLYALTERVLFDRSVGDVEIPDDQSWSWMITTIRTHPERQNWREVPCDAMGLIMAGDGAGVLMARRDRPAHIGIWLSKERRILHADPRHGVVLEAPVDLRTKGWIKLRFYEPT